MGGPQDLVEFDSCAACGVHLTCCDADHFGIGMQRDMGGRQGAPQMGPHAAIVARQDVVAGGEQMKGETARIATARSTIGAQTKRDRQHQFHAARPAADYTNT